MTSPGPKRPAGSTSPTLLDRCRRLLLGDAGSGVLLVVTTVAALVWVNVGSGATYDSLWHTHLHLGWAGRLGTVDLTDVVDEGLMTVFFFVVGLEISLEWHEGALRDRRFARLPVAAALGGMVVPALVYTLIAGGTDGAHGWGIPMATDIAFVVGVMALLGRRVPRPVVVLLLTLAIVDDLGAIVVIAGFYSSGLEWVWLLLAVVGLAGVVLLRRAGVERIPVYVLVGVPLWYVVWQSGVHATLLGVALAFLTPRRVQRPGSEPWSPARVLLERLEPWSARVVVPLFALANAGVVLTGPSTGDGQRVAAGIVVGLVVGKTVGVTLGSWLMVRLGGAALPVGVTWWHLLGAGLLAGIGFTMSLFITELAFDGPEAAVLTGSAKRAILAATVLAAAAGSTVFAVVARRRVRPARA